jgi:hypothetical protein
MKNIIAIYLSYVLICATLNFDGKFPLFFFCPNNFSFNVFFLQFITIIILTLPSLSLSNYKQRNWNYYWTRYTFFKAEFRVIIQKSRGIKPDGRYAALFFNGTKNHFILSRNKLIFLLILENCKLRFYKSKFRLIYIIQI